MYSWEIYDDWIGIKRIRIKNIRFIDIKTSRLIIFTIPSSMLVNFKSIILFHNAITWFNNGVINQIGNGFGVPQPQTTSITLPGSIYVFSRQSLTAWKLTTVCSLSNITLLLLTLTIYWLRCIIRSLRGNYLAKVQ